MLAPDDVSVGVHVFEECVLLLACACSPLARSRHQRVERSRFGRNRRHHQKPAHFLQPTPYQGMLGSKQAVAKLHQANVVAQHYVMRALADGMLHDHQKSTTTETQVRNRRHSNT